MLLSDKKSSSRNQSGASSSSSKQKAHFLSTLYILSKIEIINSNDDLKSINKYSLSERSISSPFLKLKITP
ncbi:hypothetical protein D3C86_1092000 [compost metagenome]